MHTRVTQQMKENTIKNSGFTLIEVMLVIVIIGILSALSTVGSNTKINRDKMDSAGSLVREMFTFASIETKKTNSSKSVGFSGSDIVLYDSLGCVAGKEINRDILPVGISFGAPPAGAEFTGMGGLPVGVTMPTATTWNWGTDCIAFNRDQIGNAVSQKGAVLLIKSTIVDVASLVFKIDSDNRFQHYTYIGGFWRQK